MELIRATAGWTFSVKLNTFKNKQKEKYKTYLIIPAAVLGKELVLAVTLDAYSTSPLLFKDIPWGLALLAGLLASLNECWYK